MKAITLSNGYEVRTSELKSGCILAQVCKPVESIGKFGRTFAPGTEEGEIKECYENKFNQNQ